jgi:hypothetical protein
MSTIIPKAASHLLSACRRRSVAWVCCALVLLAGIDSQTLSLVMPSSLSAPSPLSPSPDDSDDDEMLDLTGVVALPRTSRRESLPPLGKLLPIRALGIDSSGQSLRLLSGPNVPVGEHACRNGLGAPLLC